MEITGTTALFALIGKPVAQSKSPQLHNAAFAHLGVDAVYVAHEVDDVPKAFAAFRALGYKGGNVTMPYKRATVAQMDELSDAARIMNAVNTWVLRDGKFFGDNTDGAGLLSEIEKAGGKIEGARIALFGTGGAASSIWTQAGLDGAGRVTVINRPKPALQQLAQKLDVLGSQTGTAYQVLSLEDGGVGAAVSHADIIINATSVGMGELGHSLVDPHWISAGQIVADAVYHPRRTKLLADAGAAGATTVEGLRMLLGQAALSEKIWLDVDMPFGVAERAVTG